MDPGNALPPDLSAAPAGPFLHEVMGASYNWVVGLGNDQVGYIIPREHFVLAEVGAHELEADGDHYEETNSLGPDTAPLLLDAAAELIAWTP